MRRLNLTEHPALDPRKSPPPVWQDWLPQGWFERKAVSASSAEAIEGSVVGAVMGGLTVVPVRNSQLIRISFESNDSELSGRVPNALADLYIEADLEARMTMNQKANSWLTGQSGELRKKLTEAEQALQQFREREKIIDTKGLAQSGATKQLEDLQKVAQRRAHQARRCGDHFQPGHRGGAGQVAGKPGSPPGDSKEPAGAARARRRKPRPRSA